VEKNNEIHERRAVDPVLKDWVCPREKIKNFIETNNIGISLDYFIAQRLDSLRRRKNASIGELVTGLGITNVPGKKSKCGTLQILLFNISLPIDIQFFLETADSITQSHGGQGPAYG
jgi:hypothetical protein